MHEVENSSSLASFLVTASPCRRHLEETKTFMCSTPAETRVRTAAIALLCCLCRFCMLRTGSMVNRSVAGRPGLDDILLLLPKLYCRDKVCQYIDWMSKTWKTIFLHDSALSHAITLHSFNSPASLPSLSKFRYRGGKRPLGSIRCLRGRKAKLSEHRCREANEEGLTEDSVSCFL